MQFVPLSQAFPFMHHYACFDVSGNVQDAPRAFGSRVTTRLRNQLSLPYLIWRSWRFTTVLWYCKLQSVLHVQHANKVLNLDSVLSESQPTQKFVFTNFKLQNHRVGCKCPEFHGIILSH